MKNKSYIWTFVLCLLFPCLLMHSINKRGHRRATAPRDIAHIWRQIRIRKIKTRTGKRVRSLRGRERVREEKRGRNKQIRRHGAFLSEEFLSHMLVIGVTGAAGEQTPRQHSGNSILRHYVKTRSSAKEA